MKTYAVIDTNVLVSAMLSRHSDTATVQVVDLFLSGRIIPLFNNEIISEYSEVLHRGKFRLPESLIDKVLNEIQSKGISLHRTPVCQLFAFFKDNHKKQTEKQTLLRKLY